MKLAELIEKSYQERERELEKYMTGKVRIDDVEAIARLIGQLKPRPGRVPGPAAQRIADVFDTMTAEEFSQWWLNDGAYEK